MIQKPADMRRETLGTIALFANRIADCAMGEDASLGELKARVSCLEQAVERLELIERNMFILQE